jgi:exodeoxyribonuclease V beta subunit
MQYRIYTWLDVYMLVQDIYNSLKGASHVIDYADIELIARDFLLRLEDYGYFRSRLESGIRYILIDEFQDTSELQWSALRPLIANCIEGGGALFYVGDVKQSIYRWRGGEPFLFNRARKEFGIHEEILPYSYRQNRTLLDFVNDVFNALGEKSDSRFVYSDQHLPPHLADKERGYVFLRGIGGEEELAAEILKQIHSLEQGGVAVDDIAILCRTNNEVGMIETLLRDSGIAFNSAGKTRLLDDYCVRDILNAIGFVLHPDEPLFLNGLLRAPFFRCSFPFLDELSEQGTGGTMQQLKAREPKLWEAVQDILRLSRYTTPAGFVMELYRELDMFVQYPDRREPLMAFLELAYEFESSRDNVRITDFYRYLHENYERIVLSAGDHGGVTVQTIHSSKGLEYHSVIIPFLKQRFHAKLDGSFMYSRDDGGNIEHLAIAGKVYIHYHTDQQRIVRLQRENDIDYQTDEINTLYVALTRARENLIVLPQINVRSESVGTVLLHTARENTDMEDGLRIGEIVASRDEGEKEKKQYVHVKPLKQPEASGVPAWQDQEEVFSTAYRKSRRDGLIRGTLFHAVIERINDLPLNEEQLETLLAVSASREGRGYTKEELASAIRDVRPMVLNVIADPDLAKYFSDRATAELSIVSDRYQNLLGRIDRIYMGKEIEVIDFKTNPVQDDSEHERLVESYREQIDAYCSVLAEIYPNRQVHGYLYFTGAVESKRMVEVWRKT